MSRLVLVPIYLSNLRALLDPLAARLESAFGLQVSIEAPWFDPELAFESHRGQYNSTLLLSQLLGVSGPRFERVLAVTNVDLFIPVLTYVFGEAQLGGPASIVSVYRLQNEAYGMPPDPDRLIERLTREAIHELGHTFGLVHCFYQTCVMRSSTYLEEIDLKSDRFCLDCLVELRAALTRRD